jgi:hypothetical protein
MEEFWKESSEAHWNALPVEPFHPSKARLTFVEDAPTFPVGKTAKLVTRMFERMMLGNECHVGERITPDTCDSISRKICAIIEHPIDQRETVYDSLYPVFMTWDITPKLVYQIATRIAGNIEHIRKNQSIPKWDGMTETWVPVEVVAVKEHYCAVPAKEIQVFITAGFPAGAYLTQEISNRFLQYMMREIGYPRYKKFDASEIYNLKFTTQAVRDKGKIRMIAFNAGSSQRKSNMDLYKMRHGGCPQGYPIECTNCLLGLNGCPASVHRKEWVVGDCTGGHRGIMDEGGTRCHICIDKEKKDEYIKRMEGYGKPREEGRDETEQHGVVPAGKA